LLFTCHTPIEIWIVEESLTVVEDSIMRRRSKTGYTVAAAAGGPDVGADDV